MSVVPDDSLEALNKKIEVDLTPLFIEAITGSIGEMTHAEPTIREVLRAEFDKSLGDVWAIVGSFPNSPDCLVLSFLMKTARGMAERVLADTREPIDDRMILDCIGELANVLAGQVKSLLATSSLHFSFSLPKVMIAPDSQILVHSGRKCLRMTFNSDLGEFALQIIADRP
jgi:chemotaxis protein CheX